jgi:hypothetical protein
MTYTSLFHFHKVTHLFYFFFLQVLGHFLCPWSFDKLEKPLAHKQVFFPITFSGIKFMLMATIAPATYLGS